VDEHLSFYKNILKYADLSEEELKVLSSFYMLRTVQKNEYILKEGEVCNFEGYVLSGCFKVFYEDKNLRDHILYFAVEDWWVLDIGSFVFGSPSQLNIQALEDSVILWVSRDQKAKLYQELPSVEKVFRIMNQKSLSSIHMRLIKILHQNAEQRYKDFIARYPTLIQRIAQHHIAAYLGISHEFLSKVRKHLLGKKK
jgi:CRP-like cAMP-binding protein